MCTALLFTSGKLVLTGSRSWCQCLLASIHIARLLTAHVHGATFTVRDTSVQNIVGNAVIRLKDGECLDLQAMYDALGTMCTWQPNMFPGLVLRPDNSPVVLLCFYSGKVVVTGGKMETDIYDGWANLWPTVRRFIRQRSEHTNKRIATISTDVDGSAVLVDATTTEPSNVTTDTEKQKPVVLGDATTTEPSNVTAYTEKQKPVVLVDMHTAQTNTKRRRI